MAGLMTIFSRHSRIMTNFRILRPESRPNRPQLGTVRSRCAEGPVGPWSACGRAIALVGPWQYQYGDTMVEGSTPTRYTHVPVPGLGTARRAHPGLTTMPRPLGTCTYDRFRLPEGDPRGGKRTLDTGSWTLDTGSWILDTGYWILDTGYWGLAPDTGD